MDHYEDDYVWHDEQTYYDLVPYRDSVSFLDYESYEPNTGLVPHGPRTIDHRHHLDDYSYFSANREINYYAYNPFEQKSIACNMGYISYNTHLPIPNSKNSVGFNEPKFEDYDPTPYGGGYDIVTHYGKPLPPSDQTCYPRSTPKPIEPVPKSKPISGFEHQPKPMPEVENEHEPESRPKPKSRHEAEEKTVPEPMPLPIPIPLVKPKPSEYGVMGEWEKKEYSYEYDYPWPEYEQGYKTGVGYDYGYGKHMVQVPPIEYNPEVVDFCESIFGDWPCLARIRKQQTRDTSQQGIATKNNPWEGCANYIFGGPTTSCNQE